MGNRSSYDRCESVSSESQPDKSKINFKSACPPDCRCGGRKVRDWHHASCWTNSSIDNQGDISCCGKDCLKYFIKDAAFHCKESKNYLKFKTFSEFSMALAMANQSAEFKLSDQDLVEFICTLNQNVIKRWYQ